MTLRLPHSIQTIVVLSGAGMSAESGLKTFRDHDGLWENHRVEEVATPEAWQRDPELVLRFYNERRRALRRASPHRGHQLLAEWESRFTVRIITQNVDDLHERAGSSEVLHLHGELSKARSTLDPNLIIPLHDLDIHRGDLCPLGSQLRPHIVWFGESVDLMPEAIQTLGQADLLVIVGTSLQVYPAAGLVEFAPPSCVKVLIDPRPPSLPDIQTIAAPASVGLAHLSEILLVSAIEGASRSE